MHWPSDVVAGLALGLTIALAMRSLMPWPSPEEAAVAQGGRTGGRAGRAARRGDAAASVAGLRRRGIDVVFLDWGNTLMVDNGMREGPMKEWEKVEAEAGAQEALTAPARPLPPRRRHQRRRLPGSDVRLALARVGLDDWSTTSSRRRTSGDHKPNYAFFRAALLREGDRGMPLDPRRAVMVGDGTTNDIAGAQRAGHADHLVQPDQAPVPRGGAAAGRRDPQARRLAGRRRPARRRHA